MNAGIDYGLGRTNINHETGIRFGVISQGAISQAWSDSSEPDYGDATCPQCGNVAVTFDATKHDEYEQFDQEHFNSGCADFACEECKLTIDSSDCFGDEAIGWNVDSDGYKMTDCLDTDVMILESPYFTFAPYCSPCVPGAGNLDNASESELNETSGVKTYCVGHNWFEDGFAPYEVRDVATGAIVPRPPTAVVYGEFYDGGQSREQTGRHYLYASTGDLSYASHYRAFWIVPGTLSAD